MPSNKNVMASKFPDSGLVIDINEFVLRMRSALLPANVKYSISLCMLNISGARNHGAASVSPKRASMACTKKLLKVSSIELYEHASLAYSPYSSKSSKISKKPSINLITAAIE